VFAYLSFSSILLTKLKTRFFFGQINSSMCLLSSINSLQDKRRLASASDDGTVKIWEFVCPWPAGRIDP